MTGATALVMVVTLPLVGALLAVQFGRRGGAIGLVVALAVVATLLFLILRVAQDDIVMISVGGWDAPLGIALRADGLALAFLTMSAAVLTAVMLFARPIYAPHEAGGGTAETRSGYAFWPLALLVWGALNAIFLSRDLFNLYVGLEMLTIAAVALVAINGKAESIAAALRYMVFALTGSLLYLTGVGLIYAAHGTMDMVQIGGRVQGSAADPVATGLITAGLALKTALFPFHAWLPPAHACAPAPASAILSSLVPTASFYILFRFWFDAVPDLADARVMAGLGALGALAILFGSVMALRQERLKLIVAYSTVAQIGYLFIGFPLAIGDYSTQPWAGGAWSSVSFHAVSHGLAKAAMFLCAGLWVMAVGHDRLDGMKGLARAMPMTMLAFALSAVVLMGLPPSGGFTAKYLMMKSSFMTGNAIWAGVLILGGLLSAAYLYRAIAPAFSYEKATGLAPVALGLQLIPLALSLGGILLGLLSDAPLALLRIGMPAIVAGETGQ